MTGIKEFLYAISDGNGSGNQQFAVFDGKDDQECEQAGVFDGAVNQAADALFGCGVGFGIVVLVTLGAAEGNTSRDFVGNRFVAGEFFRVSNQIQFDQAVASQYQCGVIGDTRFSALTDIQGEMEVVAGRIVCGSASQPMTASSGSPRLLRASFSASVLWRMFWNSWAGFRRLASSSRI